MSVERLNLKYLREKICLHPKKFPLNSQQFLRLVELRIEDVIEFCRVDVDLKKAKLSEDEKAQLLIWELIEKKEFDKLDEFAKNYGNRT